jgi:hypothetical protein
VSTRRDGGIGLAVEVASQCLGGGFDAHGGLATSSSAVGELALLGGHCSAASLPHRIGQTATARRWAGDDGAAQVGQLS